MDKPFYIPGGTLRPDAPSYVARKADRELVDLLIKGEFCYVLTSRQMGKSSLMVRTAAKLREYGVSVIVLDLTAIGQNLTPEQWYHGLLVRGGRQLNLEDALEHFWDTHLKLSPVQRFFSCIGDVVLAKGDVRLVIFVDEIDVVRSLNFNTDEFFAGIRECYNRRTADTEFNRLAFCLLGVATPSDLIRDTRITPFNIGKRIELNDFTREEAAPLAAGLQASNVDSKQLLDCVLYWTAGHPYLTQRLCQALIADTRTQPVTSSASVDQCCKRLFFSSRAREIDDNLVFVRECLLSEMDRVGLLQLYGKVLRGKRVPYDEMDQVVSVLKLAGVARPHDGILRTRNRIYERAFDREWVRAHMPGAELRRQIVAFRLGVFRTAAISACVVAILLGLLFYARQAEEKARARAHGESLARAELEEMRLRLVAVEADNRAKAIAEAHARAESNARLKLPTNGQAIIAAIAPSVSTKPVAQPPGAALLPAQITNRIGLELVMLSDDLWVGKYEVTQGEYVKLMESNPSAHKGNPRLPVDSVTWKEAKEFCKKLTEFERNAGSLPAGFVYDLPTQAQWDIFVADSTFDQAVTSWQSSRTSPEPVGSQSANKLGLNDVLGNVWEWCLDGPSPATAGEKALRGGAFNNMKTFRFKPVTVATVQRLAPDQKAHDVGFRCVMARAQ